MGERGRLPTPTPILEKRGSWRAKSRPQEPRPEPGIPDPPEYLTVEARAAWDQIAPQIDRMGVLCLIDREALGRYCLLWARWREAEDFIAEHGSCYEIPLTDRHGNLVMNKKGESAGSRWKEYPQSQIAERLALQLSRLEQSFGLTPATRARITVATVGGDGSHADGGGERKLRFFNG